MDEKEPLLKRIPKIYERVKSWIICGAIIFLIIIFYFGDALGPWREKLLVAVALSILAILFEILLDISQNLKIKPAIEVFPSLYDALPRIRELVSHDKKETSVKIIAATGGTTVATILPTIISSSPAGNIKICMGILDPDTPSKEYIPDHWPREIETTIGRLEEFESEKVSVNPFLFEMLPVPHGLLLNDEHLFLGFFNWTTIESGKSQLSGAELPHHYYHKSHPEYGYYYNLFDAWLTHSPRGKCKLFTFDFDGVLVESYSCLPSVYKHIAQYIGLENTAEKFVERALRYEDEQDVVENYNRKSWWPMLCKEFQVNVDQEKLDDLLQIYWEERGERSKVIAGTIEVLKRLRDRGLTLIILTASDGQPNMKRRRVEKSGLSGFFNDIFVIGDDVVDTKEGIRSVMKKYGVFGSQIAFINDKPAPVNEISRIFKDITTIKVEFAGILKLAWNKEKCTPKYRIRNMNELERIIG